jgi:hypothetical protein
MAHLPEIASESSPRDQRIAARVDRAPFGQRGGAAGASRAGQTGACIPTLTAWATVAWS